MSYDPLCCGVNEERAFEEQNIFTCKRICNQTSISNCVLGKLNDIRDVGSTADFADFLILLFFFDADFLEISLF